MDAEDWDARYREEHLVWSAGPNRFVAEELADLAPGRALDLGAGEGRNAIWLAEHGWDVEAVDFSAVAIDKGRRIAADRGVEVRWTRADVTSDPSLEPADLVLLAYLQLPRGRMRPLVRRAAQLVGAGGVLLIVGHAPRNLDEGYGGPSEADVLSGPGDLVDDLEGTGVEVVRAGEVLRDVETDQGTRQAIDVLVRAARPG